MDPFRTLILMTTYRCNLRCWYCHVEKKVQDLPDDIAHRSAHLFLDQAPGRSRLRFFGGEPLLRWPLIRSVCEGLRPRTIDRDLHVDYDVTTNGILLSPEILDFIRAMHSMELILSLDPEKEKESGRRMPQAVEDLRADILGLPWLTVNLAASPTDVDGMADHFEWLVDQGFKCFNFLPAYYVKWPWDKVRSLEDQLDRILEIFGRNPELKCKNLQIDASFPLFMDAWVVDADGAYYPNNLVLADARFEKIKPDLCLGTISEGFRKRMTREEIEPLWRSCLERKILEDTAAVDWLLAQFSKKLLGLFESRVAGSAAAPTSTEQIVTEPLDEHQPATLFTVTSDCNNRCVFCADHPGPADTTVEETTARLRPLDRSRALVLTGGEPTLHPALSRIVRSAVDLGFANVILRTNARRCGYPDYAQDLVASGLTRAQVGLHGHTAALHDAMTRAPGSFAQTVQGIRNLLAHGVRVETYTVMTKSNYRHLAEVFSLARKLGVHLARMVSPSVPSDHPVDPASYVVRVQMAAPEVGRALGAARAARFPVKIHDMPPCTLGPTPFYAPDRGPQNCLDGAIRAKNMTICRHCVHEPDCAGPWAGYTRAYGWSEFNPRIHAITATPPSPGPSPT